VKKFECARGIGSEAGIGGGDIHEEKQEGDMFSASASGGSVSDAELKACVDTELAVGSNKLGRPKWRES
jgi:hypothetical protein